jgi:succinate-semialdehyde dehydrogenase/glutarate-semialdehyde dehydrogenase
MAQVAEVLDKNRDRWARLMTDEVGKPITEAHAEIDKCAWVCRFYAEHAVHMLADRPVETGRTKSYVHHEPLGAILAVMPWNFPFWQVFRFAAPALMAGNVGVLKHASNVPGCALAIADAFTEAGFPDGAFQTLLIPASRVGEVLEHPAIVAATLTGSERAGAAVAAKAGSLLKKVVLELGGSDPYLVLEDADIALAATTCAASRAINSGQSCIAAKRFIVHAAVYDEWLDLFTVAMGRLKLGDPLLDSTQVGPLARPDLRAALHRQVQDSVDAGARLVLGGEVPAGPGAFYPPTILVDVGPGMPAYDQELFGPVAAVIKVESEHEAIAVANDTPYGLGAAVFTRDEARGERIAAEQIEAGTCVVNTFVASDPRLPFGGIKLSGHGRELADLGIGEFVNHKTIVVG